MDLDTKRWISMNGGIWSLALVAALLAATGVGAFAYMNGMGMQNGMSNTHANHAPMGGMNGNMHGEAITQPGPGMHGGMGCMMQEHGMHGEHEHGEAWGEPYGTPYGQPVEMPEECREHMGELNTTTVEGTIVNIDYTRGTITLQTDQGNVTLKIIRMYVDNNTGYLVFGPWILQKLTLNTTIEAIVPATPWSSPVLPAMGIILEGSTYLAPPLVVHQ